MKTQNENAEATKGIDRLIAALEEKDGMKRRHARMELQEIGKPAVPYLIEALSHGEKRVRWEAAKALGIIGNPEAAPALVQALMDESFEIQWLASEGLIGMGKDAIAPLLKGLTEHFDSVYLRQGAHHILHDLERKNMLNDETIKVIDEIRNIEPLEPFPIIARNALQAITDENK